MHEPWAQEGLDKLGLVLCECAAHVETGSTEKAANCLARAMGLAAVAGNGPLRRLTVPMADCLARRILRPIPALADALIDPSACIDRRCVRSARRRFFDLSPFPKVAFAVSNRAIIEAMDNEKNVHVIDFAGPAAQPRQWIELLHDFNRRPEGPPQHLRLTVVHDDKDFLIKTSELLVDEADLLHMPLFQFHYVVGQLETLDFNDLHSILKLKSGEATALICTQQLHRLLATDDDSTSSSSSSSSSFFGSSSARHSNNQMTTIARLQQMASSSSNVACHDEDDDDEAYRSPATPLSFVSPPASTPPPLLHTPPAMASFLSAARALRPNVMVVTEQDASHNGVSFRKRFAEALQHYAALYGSLDAAAYGRPAAAELVAEVERAVVGEEIRGVLLSEGAQRRERHDRVQNWAARMEVAGFGNVPLSYEAVKNGNEMVRRCGVRGCESREHGGCLFLCWSSWPLYSVSAWRPNRGEDSSPGIQYLSASTVESDGDSGTKLVTSSCYPLDDTV
ncbi:hypothetical protein PR202_gb16466 [Eleusine coracana subsp. coracana]|uniref:Scarecrow-like protein 3 n=1 Tax=Eleusine coracana subsp. coracana TaxID=191504 RepID=A0AAV5F0C2_ELECO|nr:hypothetical protein PR202_gb16466 [Eleusine coracana subsp. coracana]